MALLAALLAAAPAQGQPALAPFTTLSLISDGDPLTNDAAWANVEINATAFKNQSLVTVGDYQFTSYYGADQTLILGRRNLVTNPNTWSLLRTGETSANINDSHNVSTIGVDGDGFLHVAWGVHGNPLRYMRTDQSVLNDNPFTVPGNTSGQIPLQSSSITYPEFWNIPGTGDLLLTYRTGGSGNGEYQLARWNNGPNTWTSVRTALNSSDSSANQPWIDNEFGAGVTPDANAYLNGLQYDSTGRLHVSWTWRTGANPTEFDDYQSNHNVMYAYSENHGVDWRLADGTLLQRNPPGPNPITHDIDEDNAVPALTLPMGSSLINQSSSAIGPDDTFYMATWYAPEAASGNHVRQYMLVEYDGSTWQTHQITDRAPEAGGIGAARVPESQLGAARMSRPIVMTDEDNRVFVVYSDVQRGQNVTVAYSESSTRADWQFLDLTTGENMRLWEPKYDQTRWEQDGVLSMYYQPAGGIPANVPSILEWDARAFFGGPPPLTLEVNRTTGAVTIANVDSQTAALTAYSITSTGGQLAPAAWQSLADQSVPGWAESQAAATALSESTGLALSLPPTGSRQIGVPYAGQPISFGVDGPGDLAFEFTTNGNVYTGAVNYVGQSSNTLTLFVDPETGEAELKNTSPFEVSIEGYIILSDLGLLSPTGWSSLDDQNAAGGDWMESGPLGVNEGVLSELKPTSSLTLESGDVWPLGNPYDPGAETPDLQFHFASNLGDLAGVVRYVPLGPPGDFDQDDDTDGFDFLAWQRGYGGAFDDDDFAAWRSGFGAAGVAAAHPTPEGTSIALAAIAAMAIVAIRRPPQQNERPTSARARTTRKCSLRFDGAAQASADSQSCGVVACEPQHRFSTAKTCHAYALKRTG